MKKMIDIPEDLLNKFNSGQRLTEDEILLLDNYFSDPYYAPEITEWLKIKWNSASDVPVKLKFDTIRRNIAKEHKSTISITKRIVNTLVKAAAVLFIPLLAFSIYFYTIDSQSNELLSFETQAGERNTVVLPDGTKVWLNVATKMSYPINYGVKNRNIYLEGEAYFEVTKNSKFPFVVISDKISTTALGTKFIVNTYPELKVIKSSLVEGSVKVRYLEKKNDKILKPGQQYNLQKDSNEIRIISFDTEHELSWMNNELFFRLTPFEEVITKLEKWYGVDIEFNKELLKTETLTVRFEKYETLENVLKVISKAIGFEYSIEGKHIKIID